MSAGKGGRRGGTNRWRREEIVTITGETERMERQDSKEREEMEEKEKEKKLRLAPFSTVASLTLITR